MSESAKGHPDPDDMGSERAVESQVHDKPPQSLGEKLFRALPYSLKQHSSRLAIRSIQTITGWRHGTKPSGMYRARIQAQYGIPVEAWDQNPDSEPEQRAVIEDDDDEPQPKTPIEHCRKLIKEVQKAGKTPNLLTEQRLRLAETEMKLIEKLQKLEHDERLLEDRYVREHPAWIRARRVLAATLAKYPQAAREVADALAKVGL